MQIETNQPSSRLNVIKTLAIELSIILFLTVLILIVLNFLKVIDLRALFTPQPNKPQNLQTNQVPVQSQPKSNPNIKSVQNNPSLQNLQYLAKNNALHYAKAINEIEGKIKSVDVSEGVDINTKRSYQVRLELRIGTGSATTVALYPKEAMDKVKIVDSGKKEITFKDLKVGDSVIINTNTSPLVQYPNSFNEVLITKL